MIIKFKFKNETPGTYRYEEVGDTGEVVAKDKIKIGSIYFKKSALQNHPEFLTIEVK